ncbi:GGDEF domain-containing protein [Paenibacillus sp. LjRoot153]|uniref:GGDEF domain-containing protein n=1 Tax=Paenibacillus sp. LjRoot153 TaxID=3342270 RepID=UPI003ECE3A13
MTAKFQHIPDIHQLHRKVLKKYWAVILISIVAEIVALVIKMNNEPHRLHEYIVNTMIVPTLIQLIVMGINEIAYSYKVETPLIIIVSGTCIAASLIIANKTIHIQYVFLLSMLVALFYNNIKQLTIAYVVNMVTFSVIYALYSQVRQSISIYELFAFIFIFLGMVYILRGVIRRGKDILDNFTRMAKTEQELLVKNALMDRMVKIDALTDLYNHKSFHEYLEQLIVQSNNNGMPLQLAVIDIDNFKSVNDTFGHAIGDVILVRVANALKESFSPNEILARYGGEEFAVIFPGLTLIEAFLMLEELRKRILQLQHTEMDDRKVSISTGVAEYQKGSTRSQLFAEVDSLLYAAKRSGKNRTLMPGMGGSRLDC